MECSDMRCRDEHGEYNSVIHVTWMDNEKQANKMKLTPYGEVKNLIGQLTLQLA